MVVVRVHCVCSNWVRLELNEKTGATRVKNCWKCETPVQARRHGNQIKGYYKPLFGDWAETQVDISKEDE